MKQQAKIYLLSDKKECTAIFSGTIEESPNGYYVEYDDGDGVNCIIGYSKGIATITRTKDPVYTVLLEENCPHSFQISTPFGDLDAVAHPISIKSRKRGSRRTLELVYDLVLGEQRFRHELSLKIEVVGADE